MADHLKIGDAIFIYRRAMMEDRIIGNIYLNNNYRFPEDMRGMVVVDIGANIGSASILAAQRGAAVFAYEPEPSNFELLCENIRLNGLEMSVRAFQKGVGLPGKRKLYLHDRNSGCHSAHLMPEQDLNESRFLQMDVIPLGDVFMDNDLEKIDILKIDCEGCEGEIFDEMIWLALHKRISTICVEFHDDLREKYLPRLAEFYQTQKLPTGEYKLCPLK